MSKIKRESAGSFNLSDFPGDEEFSLNFHMVGNPSESDSDSEPFIDPAAWEGSPRLEFSVNSECHGTHCAKMAHSEGMDLEKLNKLISFLEEVRFIYKSNLKTNK